MVNKLTNLKPQEVENLTKIINHYIASQTCSTLSTLLSEPVKYNVMILDKKYFNAKTIKLAADEIKMCVVRLAGKGDMHIEICFAIKMKYAKMIVGKLLNQSEPKEIDEMGTSAIQEAANIMTGSFFNALSAGTGFRVYLSTPDYLQVDIASLFKNFKDIMNPTDSVVIADAELVGEESGIRIHMLIIQDANNARKLLVNHIQKSKSSEFSSIEDSKSELERLIDKEEPNRCLIGSENSELDVLVEEFLEKDGVKNK